MAHPVRHEEHDRYHPRCGACRWVHLTEAQKEEYRERGRAQWRARNPERAVARDAILAGRSPEPCDRCGARAAAYVTDYTLGVVIWRCRDCAAEQRGQAEAA